jgi:hypothetical protein
VNLNFRVDNVERVIVEIRRDDDKLADDMRSISEKLTRIDERQQNVLARLDGISANLRAHVVGDKALPLQDRFRPTPNSDQ